MVRRWITAAADDERPAMDGPTAADDRCEAAGGREAAACSARSGTMLLRGGFEAGVGAGADVDEVGGDFAGGVDVGVDGAGVFDGAIVPDDVELVVGDGPGGAGGA